MDSKPEETEAPAQSSSQPQTEEKNKLDDFFQADPDFLSNSKNLSSNIDEWEVNDLDTVNLAGMGAFSTVHEVVHPSTGGKVYALKAVSKEKIKTKKDMTHIFDEKAALSTLKHQYIVKFHRTFNDDSTLYFLMEHLPESDLGEVILRVQKFTPEQARYYASVALLAVEHLHQEGYIYRDLKLRNLVLDSTGTPKLIDFGFIKKLALGDRTGTFCGTPSVIAPEVLAVRNTEDGTYDHAVDYWSLGIIIYEMLHGRTPFLHENMETMFENIVEKEVSFEGDSWDDDAKDLISKLLNKDPSQRLGSKGGFGEVKAHPWFSNGNETWWTDVENRKIDTKPFPLGKIYHSRAEGGDQGEAEDLFADF